MTNASPAAGGTRFSLSYLKQLGVNALWRKPIHPRGIDGRQIDPATNRPFELGSPYAAKNYFAVMPLMASGFTPGSSPAANDTPQGRAAAPRTIWAGCRGVLTLSSNGHNNGNRVGTAPLNGDANKHVVDGVVRA